MESCTGHADKITLLILPRWIERMKMEFSCENYCLAVCLVVIYTFRGGYLAHTQKKECMICLPDSFMINKSLPVQPLEHALIIHD